MIGRWRIIGGGCGRSIGRHRRHTSADRDAGGDTAPVGAGIIVTAADRDVAVHINVAAYVPVHISVTAYVALRANESETS